MEEGSGGEGKNVNQTHSQKSPTANKIMGTIHTYLDAQLLKTELGNAPLIHQHRDVCICPGDATILVACERKRNT